MSKMSDIKSALKKAFGIGVVLEMTFIGAGCYFFIKYKADEEFRNKINEDYPALHDSFKKVSSLYLSVLPEEWQKRILDGKPGGSSDGKQ